MTDTRNIVVRTEGEQEVERSLDPRIALHLLKQAIDDIGDQIAHTATELAPMGETGELKAHAFDRSDTASGLSTAVAAIGGGQSIRGEGGRFVKGTSTLEPGRPVAHIEFTLPKEPKHAIWVHGGTGLFGPYHTRIVPKTKPYLVFYIGNDKFVRRSVAGQMPQPYLTEAYEFVEASYVPMRFERLSAEIHAAYG